MTTTEEATRRLAAIPGLRILRDEPLSKHTRFALGGPADLLVESENEDDFARALAAARASGLETVVIGGGTNLVVADEGFRGIVLRFGGRGLSEEGGVVRAQAGAVLQDLVDFAIDRGRKGLETLAGIPGSVGGAVYGNAGAYGRAISEGVEEVRFFDGARICSLDRDACGFRYRHSIFKERKEWVVLSAGLRLEAADAAGLRRTADDILRVRNEKFPVTMKCAGSVFKNLLLRELPAAVAAAVPERVVKEGKVPAAYFLEQVGAKGMERGSLRVAAYHANLIYNDGDGTARELRALIAELKARVRERFGIGIEEEVQYVGFAPELLAAR